MFWWRETPAKQVETSKTTVVKRSGMIRNTYQWPVSGGQRMSLNGLNGLSSLRGLRSAGCCGALPYVVAVGGGWIAADADRFGNLSLR